MCTCVRIHICMYVYTYKYTHTHTHTISLFIFLAIDGHLGCFLILTIVNNAEMNIGGACVILNYCFCIHQINTQKWNSYITCPSILNFLRTLHTISHNGCTNVPSHVQCIKVHFFPHFLQHLLFLVFFFFFDKSF